MRARPTTNSRLKLGERQEPVREEDRGDPGGDKGPTAAPRTRRSVRTDAILGGGCIAAFAVWCPLCNGLLVAAFGAGGVLNFIEPARPFLGGAATLLLAYILVRRVRAFRSECPTCEVHAVVAPVTIKG